MRQRNAECDSERVEDQPMASIDRAWLAMDRRHNPMIVTAVLELDGVRDLDALAGAIFRRLSRHERFRQRIDDVRRPLMWRTVEAPDPGYHVQIIRSASVKTTRDLKAALGVEIGKALDTAFPLWRVMLYPRSRRSVVVLFRAHHAMADGISLMRLMLELMDGGAPPARTTTGPSSPRRGPLGSLIDRLVRIDSALLRVRTIEQALLGDGKGLRTPLVDAVGVIARTLARRSDRPAALSGALTGHRRLEWSGPLALSPLRERAHALDMTLNDLFLSALAGGIGDYLRSRGPVDPNCDVCVSIPVNLRPAADRTLGNQFGLVLLDLPVGEPDAVRRRLLVSRRMRRLKSSTEARTVLAALAAVGRMPPSAGQYLVDLVASKAAAVVSNLPGPDHVVTFDGARLKRAIFLPPQTGNVGLGVSILSYAGHVSLAVCADTGVLADPALVLKPFADELESLTRRDPARRREPV